MPAINRYEAKRALNLDGDLGYWPRENEMELFEFIRRNLDQKLTDFEIEFDAAKGRTEKIRIVQSFLLGLDARIRAVDEGQKSRKAEFEKRYSSMATYEVSDEDAHLRRYVDEFIESSDRENIHSLEKNLTQRLRREVARIYIHPETLGNDTAANKNQVAEKPVMPTLGTPEKVAVPLLVNTDRWSAESLKKKEERILHIVMSSTGDGLGKFRDTTLASALRQAEAELKERVHSQKEPNKGYNSAFIKEQQPLINHILILHKHYQLAGERSAEMKRQLAVIGEVEEVVINDIAPQQELPRPRWDQITIDMKQKRIRLVVENTSPSLLEKFREETIVPALKKAQAELKSRAHAQGEEGKRYTSAFMSEQKPLIDHILEVHKQYKIANAKIDAYKATLKPATEEATIINARRRGAPLQLAVNNRQGTVKVDGSMAMSANPFRSIAKFLHSTAARAAGAAAIVTTVAFGWVLGNGGGAQPAKADVSSKMASVDFAKAAKPMPEISKTEIVVKSTPRSAETNNVDYASMIDRDITAHEETLKEKTSVKSGFNGEASALRKASESAVKKVENTTPWAERPGVKEALAAIDDYNSAAAEELHVLDMLEEEEAMLVQMRAAGTGGSEAGAANPKPL